MEGDAKKESIAEEGDRKLRGGDYFLQGGQEAW